MGGWNESTNQGGTLNKKEDGNQPIKDIRESSVRDRAQGSHGIREDPKKKYNLENGMTLSRTKDRDAVIKKMPADMGRRQRSRRARWRGLNEPYGYGGPRKEKAGGQNQRREKIRSIPKRITNHPTKKPNRKKGRERQLILGKRGVGKRSL